MLMDNSILVDAEMAHYDLQTTLNYIDLRIRDGQHFSQFDMQYIESRLRDVDKSVKKILTKEMLNEHNKSIDRT